MIKVDLQIQIYTYKENDTYIVFAPQLDLSGYDTTLKKAHESFKIVLEEYFKFTIEKGTLIEDLKKHGWTYTNSKLRPPTKQKMKPKLRYIPELHSQLEQNYQIDFA